MAVSHSFLSLTKSYINPKSRSTPFLYYNHKPQKGTLLSTFSKSALLIQYNEFISKNEKAKQMKNSLNSCLSVKNHGPLLPYNQKNKQINNTNNNVFLFKNGFRMSGNSFTSTNKSFVHLNKTHSNKNDSFNDKNSFLNLSSGDFLKNKYLVQKIKKSKQENKLLLRKSLLLKEELQQKLNSSHNNINVYNMSNQTHKALYNQLSKREGSKSKLNFYKTGKNNELNNKRINNNNNTIEVNKPFDRFDKFKKESIFKYKETNGLVMKLNRLIINNQDYLKDYIADLRYRKYIVQSRKES